MRTLFSYILIHLFLISSTYAWEHKVKEEEVIKKTLKFTGGESNKELIIDNINGSIEVTAYSGNDVQLTVYKTITARTESKIGEAKEKIYLDIREDGNTIELFVETPYRCRDGSVNHRGWRHYGFDVTFDFELKVPHEIDLYLKTINNSEIKVTGTNGNFDLHNINGGIDALDISGSGKIYALNGDVNIRLTQNPREDCYFGSLNGEINVEFLPGLSADFRIKTFNGDVYSDFDVSYLNPREPEKKREKGKFVYKADKFFGARVGSGGPEIEFDAFNGDITIVKK